MYFVSPPTAGMAGGLVVVVVPAIVVVVVAIVVVVVPAADAEPAPNAATPPRHSPSVANPTPTVLV